MMTTTATTVRLPSPPPPVPPELAGIRLRRGSSPPDTRCYCAMQVVNLLAGQELDSASETACPIASATIIVLNDGIWDDQRRNDLLLPLLPAVVGSRGDVRNTQKRIFQAADWALRRFAPVELEALGRHRQAEFLRQLPAIIDVATARRSERVAAAVAPAAASDLACALASVETTRGRGYIDGIDGPVRQLDRLLDLAAFLALEPEFRKRAAESAESEPLPLDEEMAAALGVEFLEALLEVP